MISRVVNPDELRVARMLAERLAEGLAPGARSRLGALVDALARPGVTLLLRAAAPGEGAFVEVLALGSHAELDDLRRWASECDAWSSPTHDRVVVVRVGERRSTRARFGIVAVPHPGERVSGDGVWLDERDGRLRFALLDGLGHGAAAHEATTVAIDALDASRARPLEATIAAVHEALRSTRGAAIGLGELDVSTRTLLWLGVGNVGGVVCGPDGLARGVASHNGTLGQQVRRASAIAYPFGTCGVFHTDGVASSFRVADYPGLEQRHPALLAGVVYRDHARARDDATVLVVQEGPP